MCFSRKSRGKDKTLNIGKVVAEQQRNRARAVGWGTERWGTEKSKEKIARNKECERRVETQ